MACYVIAFAIPIRHFNSSEKLGQCIKGENESIFKHGNYKEFEKHEGLDRGRGGLVYSYQSQFSPLLCLIKSFAYSLK